MEYGSEVFNPISFSSRELLEYPQRIFTSHLLNRKGKPRIPYPERLVKLNMDSLEFRRARSDFLTMYKILSGQVDSDRRNFFEFPNRLNTRIHHQYSVQIPIITKEKERKMFPFRSINTWNKLPIKEMDQIDSTQGFIRLLDTIPKKLIHPNPTFPYYPT